MSKVLPLEWCRKMPVAEHEGFSDTDSDDKDSDYEEVVIPNAKRKIPSRQNSIPNRRYQKYIHYVEFQQKSRQKSDPGFRELRQDLLENPQSGSNQASRSCHLSLLEDIYRGESVYFNVTM